MLDSGHGVGVVVRNGEGGQGEELGPRAARGVHGLRDACGVHGLGSLGIGTGGKGEIFGVLCGDGVGGGGGFVTRRWF